jgi:hypothetical protein
VLKPGVSVGVSCPSVGVGVSSWALTGRPTNPIAVTSAIDATSTVRYVAVMVVQALSNSEQVMEVVTVE